VRQCASILNKIPSASRVDSISTGMLAAILSTSVIRSAGSLPGCRGIRGRGRRRS
jgi:hypothetical protein